MQNTSKQIDLYIEKSADFAKPILSHFRKLVHTTCPGVEEKIKWGFPHFDYKGSMMCSIASFKQHCAISFWKAALMKEAETLVGKAKTEEAMGHLGKITSLKDLPNEKVLKSYVIDAMRLNEAGIKLPGKLKTSISKEIAIPNELKIALSKNKKALLNFKKFSPSHRQEYIRWITEAKTNETRDKRIKTTTEWLFEGKDRNWKYKS